MSGDGTAAEPAIPEWDDDYLAQVAHRLASAYDLERDHEALGQRFEMYGRFHVESHKQFFHPALNYANHESEEHLYVRREPRPTTADLEALVDLGHDLADAQIEADEEHFGTEFTFVLVAESIPDDVREYVSGFRDRTLLKYGYHGQYEVNLVVVAPESEAVVASDQADVARAFAVWGPIEEQSRGLIDRLAGLFRS